MARRNRNSNRREQAPKAPEHRRRLPPPEVFKMGTEAFESKRPRFEEEEVYPMQCVTCGEWWSNDDLNEDGTCEHCEEDYDEDADTTEEEPREQASEDSESGESESS